MVCERGSRHLAPRLDVAPAYRLRNPRRSVKLPSAVKRDEPSPNMKIWAGLLVVIVWRSVPELGGEPFRRSLVLAGYGLANERLCKL